MARKLVSGIRALSPNCREATRLQSDAMDRPLALIHRVGLSTHLILCEWCRRYGRQIKRLRQAVRTNAEQINKAAPDDLSPAARERLKRAVLDERK